MTYLQLLLTIKDLARARRVAAIEDIPMVYGLGADKRQRSLADPPPELNVLGVGVRLQPLLGIEIEELERPTLRLKSNNGLRQMHDGAVSANRPPDDIIRVLEVDDDGLGGRVGFALLPNADILVRLERLQRIRRGLLRFSRNIMLTQFCHDIDAGCIIY